MASEMPLNITTLPLFPLHYVLFPQVPLQLHIFEERYRVMINGCIEKNAPFGVVLIQEGAEVGEPAVPHNIGCTARILAVKQLEDGRMLLVAAGENRFRLLDYVEADLPYLIGKVEPLEDEPVAAEDVSPLMRRVTTLLLRYLRLLARYAGQPEPEIETTDDPVLLSFWAAAVGQFSPLIKQTLLEITDTERRLQEEIVLFQAEIEDLENAPPPAVEDETAETVTEATLTILPIDVQSKNLKDYQYEGRN